MSERPERYEDHYASDLEELGEWRRLGARAKARSIDLLTAHLPRPFESLCEMGCGTGALLEECMAIRLAKQYYGLDRYTDALDYARRRNGNKITLIRHDLEVGKLDPGWAFDLTILSHVLEHLRDPQYLLHGLVDICKWLVCEVPLENQPVPKAMAWVRSKLLGTPRELNLAGHVQFFSRRSFRRMVEAAGWRILAEHRYSPYDKEAIMFSCRRNRAPYWRGLAPYYISRLLGGWLSARLLNAHYAILATGCQA